MDKNLVDRKVAIHKQQTETLKQLESELVKMIADTNNDELQGKFIDWMNQRTRCNETYLATLNVITE